MQKLTPLIYSSHLNECPLQQELWDLLSEHESTDPNSTSCTKAAQKEKVLHKAGMENGRWKFSLFSGVFFVESEPIFDTFEKRSETLSLRTPQKPKELFMEGILLPESRDILICERSKFWSRQEHSLPDKIWADRWLKRLVVDWGTDPLSVTFGTRSLLWQSLCFPFCGL